MKKGDIFTIALILVNLLFISLLIMKGVSAISGTVNVDNGSGPVPSPLPTIVPTIASYPSPDVTLAVNEDAALLVPIIRSQPRDTAPDTTVSPVPSPSPVPTDGNTTDSTVSPVPSPTQKKADQDDDEDTHDGVSHVKPSYAPVMPSKPKVPSYKSVSRPKAKGQK
jgi:hypothetical protein